MEKGQGAGQAGPQQGRSAGEAVTDRKRLVARGAGVPQQHSAPPRSPRVFTGLAGAWVPTQALMAFQRSLSVLLMLPVWHGMEAMSSK